MERAAAGALASRSARGRRARGPTASAGCGCAPPRCRSACGRSARGGPSSASRGSSRRRSTRSAPRRSSFTGRIRPSSGERPSALAIGDDHGDVRADAHREQALLRPQPVLDEAAAAVEAERALAITIERDAVAELRAVRRAARRAGSPPPASRRRVATASMRAVGDRDADAPARAPSRARARRAARRIGSCRRPRRRTRAARRRHDDLDQLAERHLVAVEARALRMREAGAIATASRARASTRPGAPSR